jgi:hypothetical protein
MAAKKKKRGARSATGSPKTKTNAGKHRSSGPSTAQALEVQRPRAPSIGPFNYEALKTLAVELGRPASTLIVLAHQNDPFYITPGRRAWAEWFEGLWRKHFSTRPSIHLREIHYVLISQEEPVKMLSGMTYRNTEQCWGRLAEASRDARLLGLVPIECFEDRRNDPPVVFLPNYPDGEPGEASAGPPLIDADEVDPLGPIDCGPPGLLAEPIGEVSLFGCYPSPNLIDVPDTIEPPEVTTSPDELPLPPALTFSAPTIREPYFHVELWAEKTSVNEVMLSVGREYKANVLTGTGFESLTHCHKLIERARASGKPVRILYISDFDPSGRNMPISVARVIEFLLRRRGLDLDIKVIPVALTHAQCVEHRLPRTPLKETDASRAAFEDQYGTGGTEVDALQALHPGVLRELLVTAIRRYQDLGFRGRMAEARRGVEATLDEITGVVISAHQANLDALGAAYLDLVERRNAEAEALGTSRTDALNAELAEVAGDRVARLNAQLRAIQERITTINDELGERFAEPVAAINANLAPVVEQAAALDAEIRARAEEGIAAINADIAALNAHYDEVIREAAARFNGEQQIIAAEMETAAAAVLDEVEWPRPQEDDDGEALFDSRRSYVEQIDRYKQHQGKPIARRSRNGGGDT